jgi:hypothetical protein
MGAVIFADATIPGEVVAIVGSFLTLIIVGFAGWVASTMYRTAATIARVENRLDDHDRRLGTHDEFINGANPEHRGK